MTLINDNIGVFLRCVENEIDVCVWDLSIEGRVVWCKDYHDCDIEVVLSGDGVCLKGLKCSLWQVSLKKGLFEASFCC